LLNDFIGLQKDSALVAVLGVTEGLRQAQITQASFFNFTPYVSLALVFVVFTIPQVLFVDWLIKRDKRRRQAGGVA
jgi:polar amino acid transport system permease protein